MRSFLHRISGEVESRVRDRKLCCGMASGDGRLFVGFCKGDGLLGCRSG